MKKVLIIFFSLLAISIIGLIVAIELYKNNNTLTEDIYSVRTNYYYTDNENVKIKLYSSSDDSFMLSNEYDVSFESSDATLRVKKEDIYITRTVFYNDSCLYEYLLELSLSPNINIINADIVLSYPEYIFRVNVGNVYYYESDCDLLTGVAFLSGLSFSHPYTSTAGIYLSLSNSNIDGKEIKSVSIPKVSTGVAIVSEVDKEETNIKNLTNYHYKDSLDNEIVTVSDKVNLLITLSYQEDILMAEFPVIINTDNSYYLIKNFKYLIINDLQLVESLLSVGEFDGV